MRLEEEEKRFGETRIVVKSVNFLHYGSYRVETNNIYIYVRLDAEKSKIYTVENVLGTISKRKMITRSINVLNVTAENKSVVLFQPTAFHPFHVYNSIFFHSNLLKLVLFLKVYIM